MKYEHIITAATSQPWLIEPDHGKRLLDILTKRAAGHKATDAELAAAASTRSDRGSRRNKSPGGTIGFIGLHGPMVQRANLFMEVSGLLSSEQAGRIVDEMAADPGIEAIVIDVDSPGGQVFGTPELAAKVAAAGKQKKVIAVANSMAASAAYYVASQATELVVTPGGMVGSIGVVMMHVDESKALEAAGQVVTVIASSEKKAGGVDPGPLSPVMRAELESMVYGYFDQFVKAVAKGRRTNVDRVKQDFGQGGMLLARDAVRVGMADRVATLDEVLAELGYRLNVAGDALVSTGRATAAARPRPLASQTSRDPEIARRRQVMAGDLDVSVRRRRMLLDDDAPGRAVSTTPRAPDAAIDSRRRAMMDDARDPSARPFGISDTRTDAERYRTAIHEAGHAVCLRALGYWPLWLTIVPTEGRQGACGLPPDLAAGSFEACVVALAGGEAECGEFGFAQAAGLSGDRRTVEASQETHYWFHADAAKKARKIVANNYGPIRAVASALMAHRHLDAEQTYAVLSRLAIA